MRNKGFTIVELLIVIVVIGILAAITIVSFNGISERAKVAAAKSFASQIKQRDITDAQGYWDFNECSGASLGNSGGNAPAIANTVTGTTTFSTDTPSGTGCSLSLNGASYIPTSIGLSSTYYSKSLWFKTNSSNAAMNFISDNSGGSQSAFYLSNSVPNGGNSGVWNTVSGTVALNDNKWHYVYLEYILNQSGNNATMTVSIDGKNVSTNAAATLMAGTGNSPNNAQGIGTISGGSNNFIGLIDDVMIVAK